ncbi:MAG: hypothetical protein QNK29_16365 [Desulfobacterales bacterium]|nr:hypothetical protein [Desulfobacterales bacterium]MDX2513536.1 hypothetical protein [Desulfobacterales bacterium]
MPADEQIRITFLTIELHGVSRRRHSGRFRFTADVGPHRFGRSEDQIAQVDTRTGATDIDLAGLNWTCEITVARLTQLQIKSKGVKLRRILNTSLGTTQRTFSQVLRLPGVDILNVRQDLMDDSCRRYTIRYLIEGCIQGNYAVHPPGSVFATRAHRGAVTYTTVSGQVRLSRIEICPVLPVPPTGLPPRPRFPATAATARTFNQVARLHPGDAVNSIENPSCIPILSATSANARNTAKLKVTYYRPRTLAFTDNDTRLEWSAQPASRIRFLNNDNHGLKVKVYGTGTARSADTTVQFTLKFDGEVCARFRAVIGPIKTLPCRFNIFNGPPGPTADANRYRPNVTPADIAAQLQVANMYMRQSGIQLRLDANATLNTARPGGGNPALTISTSTIPGIFTVTVPSAQTRNAPWNSPWLQANYRTGVLNFCYIKSSTLTARGFAFKWPEHPSSTAANNRWNFTENGTPSTSWIQPSGNLPDRAATTVTMKVIAGYKCNNSLPNNLNGMAVIERGNNMSTRAGRISYGGTIAHEVGHMLSLGHRVENPPIARGSYDDELTFPPRQNKMLYYSSASAVDFDIAQTRVMRSSALIP